MDERIKQWLIDLEQYIQKNWVAPKDAIPSEDLASAEEKPSVSNEWNDNNSGTEKKLRKS